MAATSGSVTMMISWRLGKFSSLNPAVLSARSVEFFARYDQFWTNVSEDSKEKSGKSREHESYHRHCNNNVYGKA